MGFLARFIVVKAKKLAGNRDDERIGGTVFTERFNKRITELMSQNSSESAKKVLTFSAEAKDQWRKYAKDIERLMRKHGMYCLHSEHAAKLMNNITRVAGLLHYFENSASDEILTSTLDYAYKLCSICSLHYMKYLAKTPELFEHAELFVEQIVKLIKEVSNDYNRYSYSHGYRCESSQKTYTMGEKVIFNLSDIKRSGFNKLRDNGVAESAIDVLERMEHIKKFDRHDADSNNRIYSYEFSFTISRINGELPPLKNCTNILISNLPRFSEQVEGWLLYNDLYTEDGHVPFKRGSNTVDHSPQFYLFS